MGAGSALRKTEIAAVIQKADVFINLPTAKSHAATGVSFGFKNPIVVTSASHLKRSVMIFEKVGLEVLPVPALFRSWQERQYGWDDYLPGTLRHAENAIHEYLGLVFYRFAY